MSITSAPFLERIIWPAVFTGCRMHFDSNTVGPFIDRMNWVFFWYYAGSTLSYVALMFFAYRYMKRHHEKVEMANHETPARSLPSVTIVAPAKNEQACILGAAKSLLSINYPNLEVVFVDDGSMDSTFDLLSQAYE